MTALFYQQIPLRHECRDVRNEGFSGVRCSPLSVTENFLKSSNQKGRPCELARLWLSGNRQRFGAIKRVICVLQFDPAALGTVRRSESNLHEFLGIRVPGPSWVSFPRPMPPSLRRCDVPLSRSIRRSIVPSNDGHQEDGAHAHIRALSRRFYAYTNASL